MEGGGDIVGLTNGGLSIFVERFCFHWQLFLTRVIQMAKNARLCQQCDSYCFQKVQMTSFECITAFNNFY